MIEPRAVPSIVDWAPEHLVIPAKESPKLSGLFDWSHSPHLREPCAWFNDPFVRQLTLMAGLQRGKTLFMMLCLCWVIANDPGPAMLVMTDENTLRRRMKRLRPLFAANDWLLKKLGGREDNLFLGEPTDLGDMICVLAWAGSAAMMSDYPIKYEFLDELVLWTQTLVNVSLDPMSLLRGRQNTFTEDSKTVIVSSAGNVGDLLDSQFEEGDKCEYWVECPRCSCPQILYWHVPEQKGCYAVLDKGTDGDWLPVRDYETGRHARYVCPSCMHPWTDWHRAEALQTGRWLPAGVTLGRAGRVEGEIQPSAYKSARVRSLVIHPRIGSINRMAADWVRGQRAQKTGNIQPLKYFLNNHEALSWREEKAVTDESKLRPHIGGYRTDDTTVPWGVQHVTIAIDVHDDWFRVVVLGWGFLFESWQIVALKIETGDTREHTAYAPLQRLIARPWVLADGTPMPPAAVVIDCGYRPDAVKGFCRANRGLVHGGNLWPVRGSPRPLSKMYEKRPDDKLLIVYDLNALMLKDQLWRHLFDAEKPGGGYMHLPADITPEILGELCSEHKMIVQGKPVWLPKKEGRDNHTWDASYYSLFAAHLVGIGTLGSLPEAPPPTAPPRPKPKREDGAQVGFLAGLPNLNR